MWVLQRYTPRFARIEVARRSATSPRHNRPACASPTGSSLARRLIRRIPKSRGGPWMPLFPRLELQKEVDHEDSTPAYHGGEVFMSTPMKVAMIFVFTVATAPYTYASGSEEYYHCGSSTALPEATLYEVPSQVSHLIEEGKNDIVVCAEYLRDHYRPITNTRWQQRDVVELIYRPKIAYDLQLAQRLGMYDEDIVRSYIANPLRLNGPVYEPELSELKQYTELKAPLGDWYVDPMSDVDRDQIMYLWKGLDLRWSTDLSVRPPTYIKVAEDLSYTSHLLLGVDPQYLSKIRVGSIDGLSETR